MKLNLKDYTQLEIGMIFVWNNVDTNCGFAFGQKAIIIDMNKETGYGIIRKFDYPNDTLINHSKWNKQKEKFWNFKHNWDDVYFEVPFEIDKTLPHPLAHHHYYKTIGD